MNGNKANYFVKTMLASLLIIGMLVAGVVVEPKQVQAAPVEDKVIYIHYKADEIEKNYWNSDKKIAPVKAGYVFGGWFQEVQEVEQKTKQTEIFKEGETEKYYEPLSTVDGDAFAKFVPAKVLSVKAQNSAGIDETSIKNISKDNPMYIRVITSLDSTNYNKIGFDIYLANKKQVYDDAGLKTPTESSVIYTGVLEGEGNSKTVRTAQELFGGVSQYVGVWQLSAIDTPSNAEKIIYVRPYWYTTDGTKVVGLAKYVHIEDQYLNLISIPVNLLKYEEVAAGAMSMEYTSNLQFYAFEPGRMLPEMSYTPTENIVKMIGNTNENVGEYKEGESLYANIRFKEPTESATIQFNMTAQGFCNWSEDMVPVEMVWDVEYVKKTSE